MTVSIGDKRERLTVIARAPKLPDQKNSAKRWEVRCECGVTKIIWGSALRTQKSCGCLRNEKARETMKRIRQIPNKGNTKHGRSKTREWNSWCDMRKRCTKPNTYAYERYGGRGISVCERWGDFANFFADLGPCPPRLTLDRIDNDGDYTPENCQWATRRSQANNRRSTRMLEAFGKRLSIAEWSRETGIKSGTIRSRLDVLKWSDEDAVAV